MSGIAAILTKMTAAAAAAQAVLGAVKANPHTGNEPERLRELSSTLEAAIETNTEATRLLAEENNQTQAAIAKLQRTIDALSAPAAPSV